MWNRQYPLSIFIHAVRLLSAGAALGGLMLWGASALRQDLRIAAPVITGLCGAALALTAVLIWRRDVWMLGRSFCRQSGLLTDCTYRLSRASLTALEVKRSPFLALFGSARVTLCTYADTHRRAEDSALILGADDIRRISARLMPAGKGYMRAYGSRRRDLLLLALSQADLFSGLLLTAPLILWISDYIDSRFSQRIYLALENAGRLILPDIAPALSAAALLPLVGWLVSLMHTLFSFGRFRFIRSGGTVMTGRGIAVRRTVCFPLEAVTALLHRRTLLTGILRLESCSAVIPGRGECLLLPPADSRRCAVETAAMFPHAECAMTVDTADSSRWVRWWAAACAAVLMITVRLAISADGHQGAVLLCGLPVFALLCRRAAVGAAAGKTACVRLFGDSVEITGVRRLSIYRMRIFRGSIAQARITQSIFQQPAGLCSLYLRPHGAARGLWCRHLPLSRCQALIRRLG